MKFESSTKVFRDLVSKAGKYVNPRSTLPVLANILIECDADEGWLQVSATNLEGAIRIRSSAAVAETGAITLPARTLADLLATWGERVIFQINPKIQTATITDGASGKASVKGIDPVEFPPIPSVERAGDMTIVEVDPNIFREMVERVAAHAATDDARPILTAVYMTLADDRLTLEAADGFRAAHDSVHVLTGQLASANVPAAVLRDAGKLFTDNILRIGFDSKAHRVHFVSGDVELAASTVDGSFPDLMQIKPKLTDISVNVQVADLMTVLKRAAVIAGDRHIVRLHASQSQQAITVEANQAEVGHFSEDVPAKVIGDLRTAYNIDFLRQALGGMSGVVILATAGDTLPAVITGASAPAYWALVMPMNIEA
jgi:DNA polymerase-3 subunit beta